MEQNVFCSKRAIRKLLFSQRLGSRYVQLLVILSFLIAINYAKCSRFWYLSVIGDAYLATVFRLHSMSTEVAGLSPIKKVPRIENIQVDVEGHASYSDKVPDILSHIQLV
jgi:hypothetical protein